MDRQALNGMWDQFRQKYGVYLRLLETIPADRYTQKPIAGMRSPAELVAHVSGSIVRDIALGVAKGAITSDEATEGDVAGQWASGADAVRFSRECWNQANAAVAKIGDAELSAVISTPWNMSFPGWVGFQIMNDEFVHHRGQLYAYARAFGVEPPFMWGFEQNGPGFGPAK